MTEILALDIGYGYTKALYAMRTPEGDAACRQVGIDPDANPATAALAALMAGVPEVRYLARVLPPERRGCTFPGRFDLEDNARNAGFGPRPGESGCDYPHYCPAYGKQGCAFAEEASDGGRRDRCGNGDDRHDRDKELA